MYRLVEDETQNEILTADDIRGFFIEPGESDMLDVIGSSVVPEKLPALFEDVEIQIRNTQGEEIGFYYVGRAEVTGAGDSEASSGKTDLKLNIFGYGIPFPYADQIWNTWALGAPTRAGSWKELPPDAHASWLHVAQTAWFRSGRLAKRYGAEQFCEIAGADLFNISSFYCELGEAVNGPGGYFGSNPSALEDCLINSDARRTPPFVLRWRDFEKSRDRIDREELSYVFSVLHEFGIEVEQPTGR
ncbi:barstar family protein [Streptomyces qinglanensis]|uniref:barstar family protein n=1 Tax=Streptomyces qinglanensis TaxID=943816 RepID=UPI003D75DA52